MCLSQVSLPDLPSLLSPAEHMGWSMQDGRTRIQDQLRSLSSFLMVGLLLAGYSVDLLSVGKLPLGRKNIGGRSLAFLEYF